MREFSEQNISKFKKTIKIQHRTKFAQDAYRVFANHIEKYFQECFPNENVKIYDKNNIYWIGAELKKKIAQKNVLLATSMSFPTEENRRAYKSAKNIVISKLHKAECKQFNEQFDLYGNGNHKK